MQKLICGALVLFFIGYSLIGFHFYYLIKSMIETKHLVTY